MLYTIRGLLKETFQIEEIILNRPCYKQQLLLKP